MAPHKSLRKSRGRPANTKTMRELVADIMCMSNTDASPEASESTSNNAMSDSGSCSSAASSTSSEYRTPKWRSTGGRRRKNTTDLRKRKDDHNIIERRRRDNINALIKELRSLLPVQTDLSKGSTLKAAVDYVRSIKKDQERLRTMEATCRGQERKIKELVGQNQELDRLLENAQHPASTFNPSTPLHNIPQTEMENSPLVYPSSLSPDDHLLIKPSFEAYPMHTVTPNIPHYNHHSTNQFCQETINQQPVLVPDFAQDDSDLLTSVPLAEGDLADALLYLSDMVDMSDVGLMY